MLVAGTSGRADGQAENAGVGAIGLIEEAVAAELALRGCLAHVLIGDFRVAAQSHRSEMQIVAAGADDDGVAPQLLDAVYAVVQDQFMFVAAGPSDCVDSSANGLLWIAP